MYHFSTLILVFMISNQSNDIDERKGTNTIILNKQVPISFSMFSNLPEQNVIQEVNDKTKYLINTLVENMSKMYTISNRLVFYEYYKYIHYFCVNKLKMKYYNTKDPIDATSDNIVFNINGTYYFLESKLKEDTFKNKNTYKVIKQRNESYIRKLKKWLEFPMIGYNNSFYDINICKDYGFMDCFQAVSSLKMGQKYKTLSNGKICILDQIQYCSGSPSLDAYLKSRKTNAIKGHFPYKWLTRYNKLYENTLPEYKYFESNKTTKEEYDKLFDIWKGNNMTNMFDYLRYYNNLDVVPLVEAITKHRKFYYEKGFDMHKDAISLSGLAEKNYV